MKQKYNKNTLAKLLASKEGKRHQCNIADLKEVMKCLKEIFQSDLKWVWVFFK